MACIKLVAKTAEVALAADTAKTVLQVVAPTNQRLKITRWGVAFDGVSVTAAPAVVLLERQTTAGTMSSLTPKKTQSSGSETIQSSAQHTATAEPTSGDELDGFNVHPQGSYDILLPMDEHFEVPGGGRVGIKITSPAVVNVIAKIYYEE
jgi:hypothetical protein